MSAFYCPIVGSLLMHRRYEHKSPRLLKADCQFHTYIFYGSRFPHYVFLQRCQPSGPKRDCYARGLGFDSQVEQKVLLGFSMEFSVAARS